MARAAVCTVRARAGTSRSGQGSPSAATAGPPAAGRRQEAAASRRGGQQPAGVPGGGPGQVPGRVAEAEVVDVDQQPGAVRRRGGGRAGRGGGRRGRGCARVRLGASPRAQAGRAAQARSTGAVAGWRAAAVRSRATARAALAGPRIGRERGRDGGRPVQAGEEDGGLLPGGGVGVVRVHGDAVRPGVTGRPCRSPAAGAERGQEDAGEGGWAATARRRARCAGSVPGRGPWRRCRRAGRRCRRRGRRGRLRPAQGRRQGPGRGAAQRRGVAVRTSAERADASRSRCVAHGRLRAGRGATAVRRSRGRTESPQGRGTARPRQAGSPSPR